jgi:hypothetical protein
VFRFSEFNAENAVINPAWRTMKHSNKYTNKNKNKYTNKIKLGPGFAAVNSISKNGPMGWRNHRNPAAPCGFWLMPAD